MPELNKETIARVEKATQALNDYAVQLRKSNYNELDKLLKKPEYECYSDFQFAEDKDNGKVRLKSKEKKIIDLPSSELQEAFYAYEKTRKLVNSLTDNIKAFKKNPTLKNYEELIDTLKKGYATMGENQRTGLFHGILIKIAQILESIRSCFYATEDNNSHNEPLQIGQVSHGFFALTSRQKLVIKIYEELKDKTVNDVASPVQDGHGNGMQRQDSTTSSVASDDAVEQPVAPPSLPD